MLGVLYVSRICFRVRVSTCGKQDPRDRDCREPTSQLKRRVRKSNILTYLIQIVDKPDLVIFLKVLHTSYILSSVKCLVEVFGELGRRSVEG